MQFPIFVLHMLAFRHNPLEKMGMNRVGKRIKLSLRNGLSLTSCVQPGVRDIPLTRGRAGITFCESPITYMKNVYHVGVGSDSVCMLRCLSQAQLFVTPWNITRQAPLSMGFSRQEY